MIADLGLCVTGAIKAELNSSLQTPPADSETGPLRWKLREVNSTVCQLAKKYPCIPATSTPAERVFSTLWQYCDLSYSRSAQKPDSATELVFPAHTLLTVMYACQGHFAIFKKQVGNANLLFWCMFLDTHLVKGYLLFYLQAQHWKMNADNSILLTVGVKSVLQNSRVHSAFLYGIWNQREVALEICTQQSKKSFNRVFICYNLVGAVCL